VSSNFTWFPRRFYDTRDWPARLLTDAASWEEVHGNTPLCNIPGFSPWRFQTGNSNSLFPMFYPPTNWPVRGAVNKPQLYIPISLCCWLRNLSWPLAHRWPANHDVIASTLLDITDAADRARPREVRLKELCQWYQQWCKETSSMAWKVEIQYLYNVFLIFQMGKIQRTGPNCNQMWGDQL
jgi:hypothetical protein